MNQVTNSLSTYVHVFIERYGQMVLRHDEFLVACDMMEVTWRALYRQNLMIVVLAAALLIAVMNPAGIAGIQFTNRLILCVTVGLIMTAASIVYGTFIVVHLARYGIRSAYSSQISTIIVCFLHSPLFVILFPESEFLSHSTGVNLLLVFLILAIISCAVTYIFYQSLKPETDRIMAPLLDHQHHNLTGEPQDLQNLLPPPLRGTVMSIIVEDNYVRVETIKGDCLLHLSLAAAIAKLPEEHGLRVHRSIWLNWAKIDRLFYENGNPRLQTHDGDVWPVSRTKVEAIKQGLRLNLKKSEPSQSSD